MDAQILPERFLAGERIAFITDAEELEERLGPGTQCIQLSSGLFHAQVSSAQAGALRLFTHECSQALEIRKDVRADTLCVIFNDISDGVRVVNNSRIDFVVRAGSELLWVDVDLALCPLALRHDLERLTGNRSLLGASQSASALQLRSYANLVFQISTSAAARFHSEGLRERIQRDLLVRVARAAQSAHDVSVVSRERKAMALIHSVEQFMWEHVDEPITLQRICEHANCRMRSLIYSFKDVFGVGPITYLKILRLNEAHRRLREAHGTARIFDVAAALGFWHMGHFSADYKRLFGTTASETAGRKPTPRFKSRIAQRP